MHIDEVHRIIINSSMLFLDSSQLHLRQETVSKSLINQFESCAYKVLIANSLRVYLMPCDVFLPLLSVSFN